MSDSIHFAQPERFQRLDPGPFSDDVLMTDDGVTNINHERPNRRWIIAVDFGTTFSSVAHVSFEGDNVEGEIDLSQIECITNFPDARPNPYLVFQPRSDVPTEIWYPKKRSLGRQAKATQVVGESISSTDGPDDESELSSGPSDDDAEDEAIPVDFNYTQPTTYLWGYGVQKQLRLADVPRESARHVTRFKLMLDEKDDDTVPIRNELEGTSRALKKAKWIKAPSEIITHYLEQLFKHTRNQLQHLPQFHDECQIEFVLCVPVIWTSKACRIMQTTMTNAVQASGLGNLENGSLSNLFIVSEPEAAAACVLAEEDSDICAGETFLLLDAGGGTVDAVTYTVTRSYPLRLAAEAVKPGGALCGATYINERLGKLLRTRLKNEKYLEKNGKTIRSIVDAKVLEFENGDKRMIDITDKTEQYEPIGIDDLQEDPEKRFRPNRLDLTRKEMLKIFKKSMDGVIRLMKEQLEMAKARRLSVEKVLLIGGFGDSPSLKSSLRNALAQEINIHGRPIYLVCPRAPSTAVARGAVLRALHKDSAMTRTTNSSYGFLRTEPYEPKVWEAHKGIRPTIDKADGERYVEGTIDWLIQKGDALPVRKQISIDVKHTFQAHRQKFICKEVLYVSDNNHESHYRKSHAMNKGAEEAGSIVVDMTFLKTQGLIQTQSPSLESTFSDPKNLHYNVEFELVMIIDGRNLHYEARYPRSEDGGPQSIQGKGQICIAAAFEPGTA